MPKMKYIEHYTKELYKTILANSQTYLEEIKLHNKTSDIISRCSLRIAKSLQALPPQSDQESGPIV